ncbi:hypothetical protein, partial [Kocuria marina]|uniref:hypothetical protein n=1 Tax=Kocuria marina TaxID=223184 RepID=UPI00272DE673
MSTSNQPEGTPRPHDAAQDPNAASSHEATAAEHNAPWDGTPSGDGRVATEGPANPSEAHPRAAGSSGATAADAAAVTGRADGTAAAGAAADGSAAAGCH